MDASETGPIPAQADAGTSTRTRRFSFSAQPRRVDAAPSRLVRGLKLVLPTVAAGLVTLLIAWPQLQEATSEAGRVKTPTEETSNLRMRNARFLGSDAKDRPFSVSAATTRQAEGDVNRLELEKPQADITLTNGAWVALVADRGLFDRRANTLSLSGNVELFHDEGYQVRTDEVRVDLKEGLATGDAPVVAQGPAGILSGAGFRVEQAGERILVTGRSHLQLNPRSLQERR